MEYITIEYAAIKNSCASKGGFCPVIWVDGRPDRYIDIEGMVYSTVGYDYDDALAMAKGIAKTESERFCGDYCVTIAER